MKARWYVLSSRIGGKRMVSVVGKDNVTVHAIKVGHFWKPLSKPQKLKGLPGEIVAELDENKVFLDLFGHWQK